MNHYVLPRFWRHYRQLPKTVQELADKTFKIMKENSRHPSLHLKKLGGKKYLWSARVGGQYRTLGLEKPEGIVWFWIGTHEDYSKLLSTLQ